jgi:signal transduction histidine kinase
MGLSVEEIDDRLDQSWALRHRDPAEELRLAKATHLESLEIGYELGAAAAHVLQGDALVRLSRFPEAIAKLDKATQLVDPLPFSKWDVFLHFAYGTIYRYLGIFEQSLEHFLSASRIAQEIMDDTLVANAVGNIGVVYAELGEHDKSIDAFRHVLNAATTANNRQSRFSACLNLAAAYHYTGEYAKAVEMAEDALAIAQSDQDLLAAHGNLGVAYTDAGRYQQAKHHLEKSLEIARTADFEHSRVVCCVDLADYHIKVGEDHRAIELLLEALDLAQTLDLKRGMKDCHQRLHTLYRKQQQWEKALHHHERLYQINEAMFNDKTDARIRNLEILHKVEKLRETNKRQMREYEALTQMKNTLLSQVSHDLKNPLASINAVLHIARESAVQIGDEARSLLPYFDRIAAQVDEMTQLITDVLDAARLNTGFGFDLRRTNLSDLVSEMSQRFREQSESKHIRLDCRHEDTVHVLADSNAMRRVLENVVGNAVKYTPNGGHIEIEARRIDDHTASICVQDNGVGIPENELPRIFDSFYRVSTHEKAVEGTGLGLAIVKSIVENHHGKIEVESKLQEGTKFTITLPAP